MLLLSLTKDKDHCDLNQNAFLKLVEPMERQTLLLQSASKCVFHSFHHQNPPGQEPAELDSALGCSVQLLLEVEEPWAVVLTDTILPRPAMQESSCKSHHPNSLPHPQLLFCPPTPSEVRRSKIRGEVRAAIAMAKTGPEPPNEKAVTLATCQN